MNAVTSVLVSSLAIIAAAGQTLAEGEPKSRTECADMKEMTWDSATQTCNPMKKSFTEVPVDPAVRTSPPSLPSNSETSDRTPGKPTSAPERDNTLKSDPATQTPRAPDDMKN